MNKERSREADMIDALVARNHDAEQRTTAFLRVLDMNESNQQNGTAPEPQKSARNVKGKEKQ